MIVTVKPDDGGRCLEAGPHLSASGAPNRLGTIRRWRHSCGRAASPSLPHPDPSPARSSHCGATPVPEARPGRLTSLVRLPASTLYRVLCRHRLTGWPGWAGPTVRAIRRYEGTKRVSRSTWISRNWAGSATMAATGSMAAVADLGATQRYPILHRPDTTHSGFRLIRLSLVSRSSWSGLVGRRGAVLGD